MWGDSLRIIYWNDLKRPCWEIPDKCVPAVELDESASDFIVHFKAFISIVGPSKIMQLSTYIFFPLLDNRVSVIVNKESASLVHLGPGPSGPAHPYHISCLQDWLVREWRQWGKKTHLIWMMVRQVGQDGVETGHTKRSNQWKLKNLWTLLTWCLQKGGCKLQMRAIAKWARQIHHVTNLLTLAELLAHPVDGCSPLQELWY